ncbi:MAG: hypothetical protein WBV46_09490 [Terriglobales bacterium]
MFPQAAANNMSQGATTQDFVLEITGSGFASITDMGSVHIAVLPATGVTPNPIPALSRSLDNSKILAQFTAPSNYTLQEVALSAGSSFVTFETGTLACDFKSRATLTPQIVPKSQAGNKYGNGVAKNFYAIQVSIVNECPMAIVVPLGGISVVTDYQAAQQDAKEAAKKTAQQNSQPVQQAAQPQDDACTEEGSLVAFSLDHVTSIFSADRKLTGRRAIYFNTVQALATLGSAIEPFFARGFTQGVAILGGGFTTASKELLVDMSAEQLQNLTSQSFGSTEQVASHGSLQKFVFVRRNEKCKGTPVETDLRTGQFSVNWELSPASAEAPKTLNAPAAKTPAK